MPYKVVHLAEECAIKAFAIDRDYYYQHRNSRRREIINIKQIACALAREHKKLTWITIANGVGLSNHTTAIWGARQCKNLASYDKDYAKIYSRAEEMYLESLAKMGDN